MQKRALVIGCGGQDGSFLCEILLEKGFTVHGLYRHCSYDNLRRIAHVRDRLTLHEGDVLDAVSLHAVLAEVRPHEIYNEADIDKVSFSVKAPAVVLRVGVEAVAVLLEAVRVNCPEARVFQPVSATMFGDAAAPQDEETAFNPQSPYACAKVAAYHLARHYRHAHNLFISTAILYNHDSPRRGPGYLLQRIARGEKLWGTLEDVVDIGYAREYMEAAWKMLQLDAPDDFVLGTGKGYRIADLLYERRPEPVESSKGLRANTAKAWKAFGFCPQRDAFGVLEMIRHELRNGNAV